MELKLIFLLPLLGIVGACGSLTPTTAQELTIEMYGVLEEPEDVSDEGNANPRYYEFVFKNINLLGSSGDTLELLPEEEETFKIIDRPQIVYVEDISDYEGETFAGVSLEFDPTVAVGGKYEVTDLELTNPVLYSDESFEVEKSKGIRIQVRIQWQNSLIRDTDAKSEAITEPSFDIEIESY